jgi:hypothetical protein
MRLRPAGSALSRTGDGNVFVEPLVHAAETGVLLRGQLAPVTKKPRLGDDAGELLVVLAIRPDDKADEHAPILPSAVGPDRQAECLSPEQSHSPGNPNGDISQAGRDLFTRWCIMPT